jgi:hypothetical protein
MEEKQKRIRADEAKSKAQECREMARRVGNPEHRAMLEEMAGAWDRIAQTLMEGPR